MNYKGFYINLDRRPERCAEIEAELERYGLKNHYQRFSAVDGNSLGFANPHLKAGEMGCFASHYKIMQENRDETRALHLLEDDVVVSPALAQAIGGLVDQGLFADYDIVYTDVMVPILNDAYKSYKKFYDAVVTRDAAGNVQKAVLNVVDLNGLLFASTSSYLVNPKSIRKIADLYAHEIAHEPQTPVDLFIRRMCHAGMIKVGCFFPFVTSVRLDHIDQTDIVRPYHQMSALATHIARYSFFVGADFNQCFDYLNRYFPLPKEPDAHTRILNHLLAYSLTDDYHPF